MGKYINLGLYLKIWGKQSKEKIQKISKILNISVKTINTKLSQVWVKDNLFVPLKTETKVSKYFVAPEDLEIKTDIGRTYPVGKSVAHLVGYIGTVTAEGKIYRRVVSLVKWD
ncbi:hypothetical protein HQ708_07020 [Enterococcus faecium]|nr:hypothetical protein [Enterococcus faecium]